MMLKNESKGTKKKDSNTSKTIFMDTRVRHTLADRVRGEIDEGIEKSEEIDKEAKRLLEEFSDLGTLMAKANFLHNLIVGGTPEKGKESKREYEGEKEKEEEEERYSLDSFSNDRESKGINAMELEKKIREYEMQLREVREYLIAEPENTEYLGTKSELEGVIKVTKELLKEKIEEVKKAKNLSTWERKYRDRNIREENRARYNRYRDVNDSERERNYQREDREMEEKKNERIVSALLAHMHQEELKELSALFKSKYPKLAELVNGRITKSSLLRTVFSRKRQVLRAALESSLNGNNENKENTEKIPLLPINYESCAIPAFDAKGYAIPELRLRGLDESEQEHPIIPFTADSDSSQFIFGVDLVKNTPSVVPSLPMFRELFNAFTDDFFSDIDLHGSVIAGGSVLASLLPIPTSMLKLWKSHRELMFTFAKLPLPQSVLDHILSFVCKKNTALQKFKDEAYNRFYNCEPFARSDVDIFILADTLDEAKEKLTKLYNSITRKYKKMGKEFIVVRSANAITICSEFPYRHVQLIIAALRTKDEFLLFCDMDCTSCVYDGNKVYVSPRSIHALNTRCNIVPPKAFLNTVDKARMLKYVNRGFSALVFELCKHTPHRCDIHLTREIQEEVMKLEEKEEQEQAVRDRAQYVDLRLPFGRAYKLKDVIRAAEDAAPHACVVGSSLDIVMSVDNERGERREEDNNKMDVDAFISSISKGTTSRERERERDRDREYVNSYGRERIEKRRERTGEKREESELKGIRWKIFDTIENRASDDILPRCYVCKKRFMPKTSDQVGLSLCTDCTNENKKHLERWDTLTDLDDCVALVTGARIKIGYQTALRLLRSGLTVIGVTRFPNDAARRYSLEPDWKNKLHLYGVDLRHLPSVTEFISHVLKSYTRLDILINNAAQTIRRPVAYYRTLITSEGMLHESNQFEAKFLVKGVHQDPFLIESYKHKNAIEEETALAVSNSVHGVSMLSVGSPTDKSLPKSAALAQAKLLPMDMIERDDVMFPPDKFDEHNEPLDTRSHTSWSQKIDEVSPVELMEVQTVNSTVPFMLISNLTPLLKNAAIVSKHKRSFVVNVTSAEGIFNMNKRGIHPHTNMAKAALNMMTKSISTTFASVNIFATAVDTGWITKMKPTAYGDRGEAGATPAPLQDRDGAARILHPICVGYANSTIPPYGVLLQNYKVVPWT